uniref:Ethylmalonyl-CoA decarboxylase n=1 Tax=Strongyloides papillosus TaxID=174720 RepID=A0A0N5CEK7_STREA
MLRRSLTTISQHYTKTNYNIEEARDLFKNLGNGSVKLEKDDENGIGRIVIDNQKKKNAFTGKMFVDFENCVNELKDWSNGKIVVVEGMGSDFCTGGDLEFVKKIATPSLGYWMNSYFGGVLKNLSNLPIISVANIKGFCLGGGTEIISNCDLRFIHDSGKIGVVQGKMGVLQTWNGASKLIEIVGKHNALKLLAMSVVLPPKKALEIGLVDEIYSCDDQFNKLIRKLSQNSVDVIRNGKKMYMELSKGKGLSSDELHKIELKYSTELWGSEHHVNALNSQVKHK